MSDGVPQVAVNNNTSSFVQSETAVGFVPDSATQIATAVAVYNDFSQSKTNPLFDGTSYHRNYTILGRSTSADAGKTWTYRGQISPPKGWSALGNDPSIAVVGNVIYVASLAVSDAAWSNIASAAQPDTTTTFPFSVADSFCVTTSSDGGATFLTPVCKQVVTDAASGDTTDRTAVTVDSLGSIWVAVGDKPILGTPSVRLYQTGLYGDFVLVTPAPPITVTHEPILRRNAAGDVFFGGLGTTSTTAYNATPSATIWLQRFDVSGGFWYSIPYPIDFACNRTVRQKSNISFGTFTLRNGHTYDFDVGLNEPSSPSLGGDGTTKEVVRIVWELTRNDTRDYVEVAELDATFNGLCRVDPQGNSSTIRDSGVQGMPSVKYGGEGNWWAVYLTSAGSPQGPYARPQARRPLTAFVPFNTSPSLGYNTELAPSNWSACTDPSFYWGDYFGLTETSAGHVIAFTSSRPDPSACVNGKPQHVVAQTW